MVRCGQRWLGGVTRDLHTHQILEFLDCDHLAKIVLHRSCLPGYGRDTSATRDIETIFLYQRGPLRAHGCPFNDQLGSLPAASAQSGCVPLLPSGGGAPAAAAVAAAVVIVGVAFILSSSLSFLWVLFSCFCLGFVSPLSDRTSCASTCKRHKARLVEIMFSI